MSPLEKDLDEGTCVFCFAGPCDAYTFGMPCHRLCAEEDAYRAQVDREVMAGDL